MAKIPIDKGWLPDFPSINMPPGGLVKCQNLLPYDEYYGTAKGKLAYSASAVSGVPRTAVEYYSAVGGVNLGFIGTSTSLYRLNPAKTLTDVTRAAGTYTCGTTMSWHFERFGEYIIATDFNDVPQVIKIPTTDANFVALGGSPPLAKYILYYNGHMLLAYTKESSVDYPQRIWRSAFQAPETWTPSLSTGSGYQDYSDMHGKIVGLAWVGKSLGVFCDQSISIGWFDGGGDPIGMAVNQFDNMAVIENTIVSTRDAAYCWTTDDIWKVTPTTCEPIGVGVRKTVLGELHPGFQNRISAKYDYRTGFIFWAYPTVASADGTLNRILVLNPAVMRWTTIEISVMCLFAIHTGALLMDDLASIGYTSMDDIPYEMDSNYWLAGTLTSACVDTTGYVAKFSALPLTGVLETGDIKGASDSNQIIQISHPRPLIANPTVADTSMRIGKKRTDIDAGPTYTNVLPMTSAGRFLTRVTGRSVRLELTTGTHGGISGYIEADIKVVGTR